MHGDACKISHHFSFLTPHTLHTNGTSADYTEFASPLLVNFLATPSRSQMPMTMRISVQIHEQALATLLVCPGSVPPIPLLTSRTCTHCMQGPLHASQRCSVRPTITQMDKNRDLSMSQGALRRASSKRRVQLEVTVSWSMCTSASPGTPSHWRAPCWQLRRPACHQSAMSAHTIVGLISTAYCAVVYKAGCRQVAGKTAGTNHTSLATLHCVPPLQLVREQLLAKQFSSTLHQCTAASGAHALVVCHQSMAL